MDPLEIKKYPEKVLRKKSKLLVEVTAEEKALFEQMLFTMKYFSGIGLAAPQIGILKEMIVAEVDRDIIRLANPEVIDIEDSDQMVEGCLSIPDVSVDIERPYKVTLKGLNEDGKIIEVKAEGLLARVLLHEIDHLKGKLIIDYMPLSDILRFAKKRRSGKHANL
ncbi:MAG: peptide deformylase [Candidatus Aureabacteria bacterium]|nr:peptide deformylase [Candidatus Auribacterota bacterium]